MMTQPVKAVYPVTKPLDRIIVALDVDSAEKALEISRELSGHVGAFKIGLQLFTAAGPQFVREIAASGIKIFLDLKFHDIPNTVAKASVEAVRLGVWMFNVHAAGGVEMMRRSVAAVSEISEKEQIDKPYIIGVTVLTSSNVATLRETGVSGEVEDQVIRLALLAENSGLDGVVASAKEVGSIRSAVTGANFLTITPGIRPTTATGDDQKRVTTFAQAVENGSDFVVIGRPIIDAPDRVAAIEQIVAGARNFEK